jgi:hypothetical protein
VADVRFLLLLSVLFDFDLVGVILAAASFFLFLLGGRVCCVDDDRGLGDDCSVCLGFGFCEDDDWDRDDAPFFWPTARAIFFHNLTMVSVSI